MNFGKILRQVHCFGQKELEIVYVIVENDNFCFEIQQAHF